jgi:hypothetical protein
MLWGEGDTTHNPMEEELQPCNQKQREMFARLLAEAKKRQEAILESESDLDNQIEDEIVPKLAQEKGASELIAKVQSLHKELDDAEKTLGDLGFSCDDDSIRVKWDAPKDLRKALDAAKRSARQERQRSLRKYDLAILGVWSAENVNEAKRIVEELL